MQNALDFIGILRESLAICTGFYWDPDGIIRFCEGYRTDFLADPFSAGFVRLTLANGSSNSLFFPLSEGSLKAKYSECFKQSSVFAFV